MSDKDKQCIFKRILELGWDDIAWCTTLLGSMLPTAPPFKPNPTAKLTPVLHKNAMISRGLVQSDNEHGSTIVKQWSRLTVILDEVVDAQAITVGNEFIKNYDIIAASPGNAKVFSYLCKTAEIDIISIDFTHRVMFPMNKKLVRDSNDSITH